MIVSAVSCPAPPLLLPGATGLTVPPEVAALRSACGAAVGELLAAGPDVVAVVGAGTPAGPHPYEGAGAESRYTGGTGRTALPLSLSVGRTLLGSYDDVPAMLLAVDPADPQAGPLAEALHSRPERFGLLVLADGCARRGITSPGWLDERAAPFDAAVGRALAEGDAEALAGLDQALAADLLAAGAPAWAVLGETGLLHAPTATRLTYEDSPYGVYYPVAVWRF